MLSCNVSRLQMSCLHRLSPHSGRCRVAASAGSYGAIPSRVFASFGKRQEFAYVDHNIGGACNWRFAVERQHGYGLRLGFPGTPPSCQSRGAITELAPAGLETVENSRRSVRSEEHTSELQSLMRISYAVFCLKKKTNNNQ